jgi:hypothetical protein
MKHMSWLMVHSKSMTCMERVSVRFHMIQLLLGRSTTAQLEFRSSWSILGMMVHRQHSSEWMAGSSSTQQMEMAQTQQCTVGLMARSNIAQLLVLHRNQSRRMELVRMTDKHRFVRCMCNSRRMGMG